MNGTMTTGIGEISIDSDVIAKYVGSVAVENVGIVGMASINVRDGLAKLLKVENMSHGIKVEISEDNKLKIDLHIIVSYGSNIPSVCRNLIESVSYKVESFTGMKLESLRVFVEGVRVID